MSAPRRTAAFWIVWGVVILLGILHQDLWFWDDTTLVLGFLPVGLFYHAMFSLACGVTWAMAVKFCWPKHVEQWADQFEDRQGGNPS